jgi:hypothetical protein
MLRKAWCFWFGFVFTGEEFGRSYSKVSIAGDDFMMMTRGGNGFVYRYPTIGIIPEFSYCVNDVHM